MNRFKLLVSVLFGCLAGATNAFAVPSYVFDITTFYQFGGPADLVGGSPGGPDTGFFRVTNNGASTFSGTLALAAVTGGGVDHSVSVALSLAPGQSASITDSTGESSNQGGYGGPSGSPQLGATLSLIGSVALGLDTQLVNLAVSDSNIHSGVFATNPFGVSLDNYVFQGGDPLGRDTGDAFEVAQAPGKFRFAQGQGIPVPAPLALMAAGLIGLAAARKR